MKPTVVPLPETSRRGIALLTVLALLTLTSILILAFFSISQTELRSTSCYAGGAEAHELSKTAVDLVMHQIRAATEDSGTAWASQPGAIRVWGKNQGQESVAAYKLYSDDRMTEREPLTTSGKVPLAFTKALYQDTADLRDWWHQDNKDVFVDLNEPILRSHVDQAGRERTKIYYPIVDPRAYVKGSQKQVITRSDWDEGSVSTEDKKREVEGFFYETTTVERGPYPAKNGQKIDHYVGLPMPVKWFYQLKDGTLGTLERGSLKPRFKAYSGAGLPSKNNPMVGRIAFWTDDETCKVNVNTAAGGSPWDTPRAGGKTDREDFAAKQPVQHEWQRYPGHPATTSLAPVLFPNRTRAGEAAQKVGRLATLDVASAHEKIYTMVPRVEPGGSAGGLEFWKTDKPDKIASDHDRLYATIDEFIFQATKKSSQGLREIQEVAGSWGQLDGEFLDRVKFFLTTASRAPEVTVFNTPRISVWPTYYVANYANYARDAHFTQFDRQIRFCSEVGNRPNDFGDQYHFQRKNEDSATEDFGTDIDSRGSAEGILRNRQVFKYLLWLMKQDIPGTGKSLASKYGDAGTQQIATEIFDYIRCTNLFDDTLWIDNPRAQTAEPSETPWGNNPVNHLAYTNNRVSPPKGSTDRTQVHAGHGQVTPIEITSKTSSLTTKGFGRFHGLNEVGIGFIATASVEDENKGGKEVLGGRMIPNFKQYPNDWKLFTSVNDDAEKPNGISRAFDFTNVPPFDLAKFPKPPLPWDGHKLDPKLAADIDMIANQNYVASLYTGGSATLSYLDFADKKDDRGNLVGKDLWNYLIDARNWNYTLPQDKPIKYVHERRVQAILLFSMFNPGKGWTAINSDFRLKVEFPGKKFSVSDNTEDEPCRSTETTSTKSNLFWRFDTDPEYANFELKSLAGFFRYHDYRPMGGLYDPRAFLIGQHGTGANLAGQMPRYTPDFKAWKQNMIDDVGKAINKLPSTYKLPLTQEGDTDPALSVYPWVSDPFTVRGKTFKFDGGYVRMKLYAGGGYKSSPPADERGPSQFVEIEMEPCTVPAPNCARSGRGAVYNGLSIENSETFARDNWCFSRQGGFLIPQSKANLGSLYGGGGYRGRLSYTGNDPAYNGSLIKGFDLRNTEDANLVARNKQIGIDVVRSYVIPSGDYRLALAKKSSNPAEPDLTSSGARPDFVPHAGYGESTIYAACAFATCARSIGYGRYELHVEYNGNSNVNKSLLAKTPNGFDTSQEPPVPVNSNPQHPMSEIGSKYFKQEYASLWGDWDNTTAAELDGPYINKPDEGNSRGISNANYVNQNWRRYGYAPRQFLPYYTEATQQEPAGASFFSPNRMMPGPGVIGSLPTGVGFDRFNVEARPWQTLLFRPLPNNGQNNGYTHPGFKDPKDHYMLDFFWMPIVEPWSISEPFSTAGKINLNYAMQPFTHIKRASGVIAAMYAEQMLTIPSDQRWAYKALWGRGSGYNWLADTGGTLTDFSLRSFINHTETLKQFDSKFANPNSPRVVDGRENEGDLFRTASELCEQWLVPDPVYPPNGILKQTFTLNNTPAMWDQNNENGFTLVGDNSRERPYTTLLARLTTKSNTFQVHYRAQIIKQGPMSPTDSSRRRTDDEYETFDSDVDAVAAEYRGSSILERYIDPNEALLETNPDKKLPDYAKLAHEDNLRLGQFNALDRFYRFRVVSEKRFAP